MPPRRVSTSNPRRRPNSQASEKRAAPQETATPKPDEQTPDSAARHPRRILRASLVASAAQRIEPSSELPGQARTVPTGQPLAGSDSFRPACRCCRVCNRLRLAELKTHKVPDPSRTLPAPVAKAHVGPAAGFDLLDRRCSNFFPASMLSAAPLAFRRSPTSARSRAGRAGAPAAAMR